MVRDNLNALDRGSSTPSSRQTVMSLHRVALIFDDRLRPDTTEVYVRRALARLVEVAHFRPDQVVLRAS